MSPRMIKTVLLTALALLALVAAALASENTEVPEQSALPTQTPAALFRSPALKGVSSKTTRDGVSRPAQVAPTTKKAVKKESLMRRLGALPDRRHLLLRGASRRGGIPRNYLVLYKLAATRYSLGADGWAWLAAVGYIESLHGRTMAPGVQDREGTWWLEVNHAYGRAYCCSGPMQFNIYSSASRYGDRIRQPERRSTWTIYAVDANGDGRKDPHDARDSIFAAARKLARDGRSGGHINWRQALLRYNNSEKYVRSVTGARDRYLRAARKEARAVRRNQLAFTKGQATVTSRDMKIPKADRKL